MGFNFTLVREEAAKRKRLNEYKTDPLLWCKDKGLFVWSKQGEILQSLVDHKKTLVVTGNGMGKSRITAQAVAWIVDCFPVNNTTVVTTATSWRQVANVLWKEIPRIQGELNLPGKINRKCEWWVPGRPEAPIAYGHKPDDTDETGFQGIHDGYVFALIDEAGGISKQLFTAVDAITTGDDCRVLAIANPNDPSCYMAEIYHQQMKLPKEDRTWNIIQFGAFDSPNFTGEPVPPRVAQALTSPKAVEAMRKEWGEDDPRYIARVLGQFPDVSDDGLFNMGAVMRAMAQDEIFLYNTDAPVRLGVDAARYGKDYSVIASFQDGKVKIEGKYQGKTGPELARLVAQKAEELKAKEIRIDGVGVGVSLLDALPSHVSPDTEIISIKGNGASPDKGKWFNWRAAMYDKFARDLALGKISLPQDDTLFTEIRNTKYVFRGSALLIESKEDMRRRGIKSPDILDAVIYAAQDIEALYGESEEQETIVDLDTLMGEDLFAADEFGFYPWSLFPA